MLAASSPLTCGEKTCNAKNQNFSVLITPIIIEREADNAEVIDNLDESENQVDQGKVCALFAANKAL